MAEIVGWIVIGVVWTVVIVLVLRPLVQQDARRSGSNPEAPSREKPIAPPNPPGGQINEASEAERALMAAGHYPPMPWKAPPPPYLFVASDEMLLAAKSQGVPQFVLSGMADELLAHRSMLRQFAALDLANDSVGEWDELRGVWGYAKRSVAKFGG